MDPGTFYNIASEETYQDGQIIFKEGSSGDWVYIVFSGSVEISRTIGGKKFILGTLQPGETFGELSLIGAMKRTGTARAIGKTTVGLIDRTFLDNEFNRLSAGLRTILVTIAQRYIQIMDGAREFTARREERVKKSLSLTFKDRQTFVKAYTENLSSGGLFIKTEHPLEAGQRFPLELHIPDVGEPLQTKCQVAWVRKPTEATGDKPAGMGVKFVGMPAKDAQILKQYLRAVMKEEK
jgi:type IV pilus assembly protein PilZ